MSFEGPFTFYIYITISDLISALPFAFGLTFMHHTSEFYHVNRSTGLTNRMHADKIAVYSIGSRYSSRM